MFEIEKMNQEFDYSLVSEEEADFLRSCEYEMNGIAEDARVRFGRVLKKVQDKLANHSRGVFYKWFESGGMNKHDVYYAINLYELSINLDNAQKDNFLKAPKSLQKEAMKKSAPEDLKQQVYDGDITTHKEYKELLRQRNEERQAKEQAESKAEQAEARASQYRKSSEIANRKLEEAEEKEPEVRIEYIEKEAEEPYDRRYDRPFDVERTNDFYVMMNEVDGLYKKYAHLRDSIDEMKTIAKYDSDLCKRYTQASELWEMLGEIFNDDSDIIDAEII